MKAERRATVQVSGRIIALFIFICVAFLVAPGAGAQTAAVGASEAAQDSLSSAPPDTAEPVPAPAAETLSDTTAAPPAPAETGPSDTTAAPPAPAETALPDTTAPEPIAPARPSPGIGGVVIYGKTTFAEEQPLPAVKVTLFLGGLEAAVAETDTGGAYSITHDIDRTSDETVVMWFTPPRGAGLVREIVVLKESRASRQAGLYGPCFTRAIISDSTRIDVKILDQQTYAAKLEESGCMEMMVEQLVEYEPSYNLDPDSTYILNSTSSETFSQQYGGTEMTSSTQSTSTYTVNVDSVTAEGMALTVQFGDGTITSDDPSVGGSVDLSPLVGQQVSMLLSPSGETSRFRGFESLPEIEMGQGRTIGPESHTNAFRFMFPRMPEGPVAQGDSWSAEYSMREPMPEGFGTITATVTYTLVGEIAFRDINCLEVNAESEITYKGEGVMGGNPITINMAGSASSKIYFAHELGMLLEMTQEARLEGTFESMGMNIPVTNQSESKLEMLTQ